MKFLATIFIFCSVIFAQTHVSQKYVLVADSVRWGGANDSTGHVRYKGGNFQRDSLGTWVSSDSCSRPILLAQEPIMNVVYDLRLVGDSTNITDTAKMKIKITPYTRYCRVRPGIVNGRGNYLQCDMWVPATAIANPAIQYGFSVSRSYYGALLGTVGIQGSLAGGAGSTIAQVPTSGLFSGNSLTLSGNSVKMCVTSTNVDTTNAKYLPFEKWVLRGQ